MRVRRAIGVLFCSLTLCACGSSGTKAQPAQVEIEWPDAAVQRSGSATLDAAVIDAGVPDSSHERPGA